MGSDHVYGPGKSESEAINGNSQLLRQQASEAFTELLAVDDYDEKPKVGARRNATSANRVLREIGIPDLANAYRALRQVREVFETAEYQNYPRASALVDPSATYVERSIQLLIKELRGREARAELDILERACVLIEEATRLGDIELVGHLAQSTRKCLTTIGCPPWSVKPGTIDTLSEQH